MLFNTVTVVAILAAVVHADTIPGLVAQIPSCAVSCLDNAISSAGCGNTDYVCQCTTGHDAILANAVGCLQGACSSSDFLTTTDLTTKICALATAGGTGGSSAVSAAKSATSAAASAASAASSAANAASSSVAAVSSAASVASTSASATAAASPSAATSSAASASPSASPSSNSTSPNAGNGLKVGVGMLGAAFIGALAL